MTQIERLPEGLLALPPVIRQQQKHGTMDSAIEIICDPIKQVRTWTQLVNLAQMKTSNVK